jgi:DNA-binding Xre family transcriptional regulator
LSLTRESAERLGGWKGENLNHIKAFQSNLEKCMSQKGISLFGLAKEAKLSYRTLWKIQNGQTRNIHLSTLESVAKALEVSVDDLLRERVL